MRRSAQLSSLPHIRVQHHTLNIKTPRVLKKCPKRGSNRTHPAHESGALTISPQRLLETMRIPQPVPELHALCFAPATFSASMYRPPTAASRSNSNNARVRSCGSLFWAMAVPVVGGSLFGLFLLTLGGSLLLMAAPCSEGIWEVGGLLLLLFGEPPAAGESLPSISCVAGIIFPPPPAGLYYLNAKGWSY